MRGFRGGTGFGLVEGKARGIGPADGRQGDHLDLGDLDELINDLTGRELWREGGKDRLRGVDPQAEE